MVAMKKLLPEKTVQVYKEEFKGLTMEYKDKERLPLKKKK